MDKPFVLCAEDNQNDVQLMQRVFNLELEDFEIFFNSNVDDSIDFLKQCLQKDSLPVLILLDIKLINSNGLEILKYVRENIQLKHLPTVVLSSSDRHDDKLDANILGCDGYIEKPKNYLDLKEKIPKIVNFWTNKTDQ